jgi:hypothetical protein
MSQNPIGVSSVLRAAKPANFHGAQAGLQIKSGPGVLVSLNVNITDAQAHVTLYDGTDATGTKLGTWIIPNQIQIPINLSFAKGLFAVADAGANGTGDVTIGYR